MPEGVAAGWRLQVAVVACGLAWLAFAPGAMQAAQAAPDPGRMAACAGPSDPGDAPAKTSRRMVHRRTVPPSAPLPLSPDRLHPPEAMAGMAALALSWIGLLRRRIQGQAKRPGVAAAQESSVEQRYRELVDNANDIIYRHDLAGHLEALNPAGQRILGYTHEEALRLTLDQILPPDQREKPRQMTEEKLATGRRTTYELDVLTHAGQRLTLEVSSWLVHQDGQPVGVEGIARDITERKATEAALRASDELNRTLLASLPQRIFFKDCNSVFRRVNEPFARDLGLRPEKIVGKTDHDFFPPELADKYRADDQRVMAAREPVFLEERNVVQGKERVVEVVKAPVRDQRGELIGLLGLFTDITERKRAEEERQRMQAFLNSVVENLPLMVFIKDATDLRFVLWNKSGEDLVGYTSQELVGKSDYDLFPKEQADAFVAKDRETLEQGKLVEIPEEKIQTRKRGCRILRTRKIPICDPEGRPQYLLGIAEDITDRKQTEIEMENLHKRLLDASRQAGMAEVATGVLHNVGNVLNSINVSVTVLSEKIRHSEISNLAKVSGLLTEHQKDLAAYFSSDAKGRLIPAFLSALTEQLREEHEVLLHELASLQRNIDHVKDIVATQQSYAKMSGVVETLPVPPLVEDALRMNTGALERHKIEVVREYEEVPAISVEKHKVLQILINLVRNAKYALDEHSTPNKRLTLRIRRSGDRGVRIEVSDNGIGIAAGDLTRVFAHGFTTRKDGHGFGLHSGALAAREMGGSLKAQSAGRGQGATFILELPLSRDLPLPHE